ncbi:hypothetical protein F5B21DRAFT_507942 [Xylaria acuta]|nr:hypothetical protein F5B21DRAFT_507942 [Xylaria acuta]
MSKYANHQVDDRQGNPEDIPEAPTGAFNDNSYVKQPGDDGPIDVVEDDANIEDPVPSRGADSDRQLEPAARQRTKAGGHDRAV